MRQRVSDVAVALGLALIALLWVLGPLIKSDHYALSHWSGSPLTLFLAPVFDLILVWFLLWLLLSSARKPGRWRTTVWLALLLLLPWVALKSWAFYDKTTPSHLLSKLLFLAGIAAFLALSVCWRPSLNGLFERCVKFASTLLAFLALTAIALLLQVAWHGWKARELNPSFAPTLSKAASIRSPVQPRIIWIVFDELSYRQVYEQRFPGLQLPAFDSLARQATLFSHVVPAGNFTERVLPSLISGKPVDLVRSSPAGYLFVHNPTDRKWTEFDQHDTVFQDALSSGYSTGVAGWHIPYCRIMPAVLDHCFWTYGEPLDNGMTPYASIATNMWMPAARIVETGAPQRLMSRYFSLPPMGSSPFHIRDDVAISSAADKLLLDPSVTFTLLHLPIPHPPGIYNRHTGQFTTGPSTYIDNLVLADKSLAHIRAALEQSGQWNSCTLVIMGDHSWRVPFWRAAVGWTNEEERASSGGQFDTRPLYLVKLPDQQTGAVIQASFPAQATRPLLDGLLTHSIRSQADLTQWAEHGSRQVPPR